MEVARAEDKKNRQEEVAQASRHFWAEEVILSEVWKKIQIRKELGKLAKIILTERLNQVILMKQIVIHLGDEVVESVETQIREERKKEGELKNKKRK